MFDGCDAGPAPPVRPWPYRFSRKEKRKRKKSERKKKRCGVEPSDEKTLEWPGDESNAARNNVYTHLRFIDESLL